MPRIAAEHTTPDSLGWSEDDPNCLTRAEIDEVMAAWVKGLWKEARKAIERTGCGDPDDYHAAAMWGMWEGLLRYRRDTSKGATPSSYATWWVRRRVRDLIAHEAGRGMHVPDRKIVHTPVTTFSEISARFREDGTDWEPGSQPPPRPPMTTDERTSFWSAVEGCLPRREFQVVRLVTLGRTQPQIAYALQTTRARVSQIYKSGMARLRDRHTDRLRGYLPEDDDHGEAGQAARVDAEGTGHAPGHARGRQARGRHRPRPTAARGER